MLCVGQGLWQHLWGYIVTVFWFLFLAPKVPKIILNLGCHSKIYFYSIEWIGKNRRRKQTKCFIEANGKNPNENGCYLGEGFKWLNSYWKVELDNSCAYHQRAPVAQDCWRVDDQKATLEVSWGRGVEEHSAFHPDSHNNWRKVWTVTEIWRC